MVYIRLFVDPGLDFVPLGLAELLYIHSNFWDHHVPFGQHLID